MLSEFISAYSADGIIYSPEIPEGESGYVYDGFIEKIYVYLGDFPDNYAIFLNSHADYGSECGVFVCDDTESAEWVTEMCLERMRLLDRSGENALVISSSNTVFYSTMSDKARAEEIWHKIIGK